MIGRAQLLRETRSGVSGAKTGGRACPKRVASKMVSGERWQLKKKDGGHKELLFKETYNSQSQDCN